MVKCFPVVSRNVFQTIIETIFKHLTNLFQMHLYIYPAINLAKYVNNKCYLTNENGSLKHTKYIQTFLFTYKTDFIYKLSNFKCYNKWCLSFSR